MGRVQGDTGQTVTISLLLTQTYPRSNDKYTICAATDVLFAYHHLHVVM